LAVFFLSTIVFSQNFKEKKIETNIFDVKVYLNNAEISRDKKIVLPTGNSRVVFTGLSPELIDNSVRFNISPEVSILQITVVTNYLENDKQKPKIKVLLDSVKYIDNKVKDLQDELNAYNSALDVLKANKNIGGQNNGVQLNSLKVTVDYYLSENLKLNKKITKINREIVKLNARKTNISKQLIELNAQPIITRKEVELLISTDKSQTCNFSLKYLVNNAGWAPLYDIKAIDTDKPVKLTYRAQVYNNTKIDWNNIPLTLSINNPNLSNTKPQLITWFLKPQILRTSYNKNLSVQKRKAGKVPNAMQQKNELNNDQYFGGSGDLNGGVPDYTENDTYVPVLSHEFEIDDTYDIPSDNKPYLVDITEEELKADYKHYGVPKLDKRIFLLAQVTGWQELNLIDGQANIYYAGSYIGRSFISISGMNDTLDLSLGADSKVFISRKKLNQLSSTKFIGNKKTVTFAFEITLKNNHKSNVHVEVLDQIPISQNNDIEVKDIELTGGELNETSGVVKWNLVLKPGETKKLSFVFSIKYPKNMNVQHQQMKNTQIRYYN
ncbi:MAG: DUF4139 domain-containing protein, partial [Bacteroidota bacterium]|nr:DUF4139 domain-containing protein [Bacteroidota bacterium]